MAGPDSLFKSTYKNVQSGIQKLEYFEDSQFLSESNTSGYKSSNHKDSIQQPIPSKSKAASINKKLINKASVDNDLKSFNLNYNRVEFNSDESLVVLFGEENTLSIYSYYTIG
jgi:hypothetical protein